MISSCAHTNNCPPYDEQPVAVVGEKFLRGIFKNSGGGNVNKYRLSLLGLPGILIVVVYDGGSALVKLSFLSRYLLKTCKKSCIFTCIRFTPASLSLSTSLPPLPEVPQQQVADSVLEIPHNWKSNNTIQKRKLLSCIVAHDQGGKFNQIIFLASIF